MPTILILTFLFSATTTHCQIDSLLLPESPTSVYKAYALSILATTLPILAANEINAYSETTVTTPVALFLTGSAILFGPSTGQYYLHRPKQALVGTGIRTAGVCLILAGYFQRVTMLWENQDSGLGTALIGVGTGTALIGSLYSFVDLSIRTHGHNNTLIRQYHPPTSSLSISPLLLPMRPNQFTFGIATTLRF